MKKVALVFIAVGMITCSSPVSSKSLQLDGQIAHLYNFGSFANPVSMSDLLGSSKTIPTSSTPNNLELLGGTQAK